MWASLKLLSRLFLAFGGLFGGLMGLMVAGVKVAEAGVWPGLLWGAGVAVGAGSLSGAAFALVCGGWHLLSVWRLGFRLTDQSLSVRQRRELTTPLPFAEAFALCTASVRHLGRADIDEETDYAAGVILATRRVWWRGYAERIQFSLRSCEGGTKVIVESRPGRWGVLADDGNSLRTLDVIVGFLLAHGATMEARGACGIERRSGRVTDRPGGGSALCRSTGRLA